jgi:hypothetical protein
MNAEWLISWWNLIFLLPFGLALLYLGLYTVSGVTFGEGDFDADHDFDADADADGDFEAHDAEAAADHDADASADADQDADTDHDSDDTGSGRFSALTWLGVGKVPLSILLMVLLFTWGATGFFVNVFLAERGGRAVLVSLPAAAVASLLLTRLISAAMARWVPLNETTARRRHALLGSVGQAVFAIDHKFGMASVRDDLGDLYQVPCRVGEEQEPVAKGSAVKLVAYNAKLGLFYVKSHDPKAAAVH